MIKAIIFDCFGVLVGSGFKEVYRQAGGDPNKDSDFIDDVLAAASSGMLSSRDMHQQVADKLGITIKDWSGFIGKHEQPNQELMDYIEDLQKRYKLAILSNATHGILERKFSSYQLALFQVKTVSAEAGVMKPNPEIYEITAERLGVAPEECVFTDDNPLYCEAAEAVGMKGIWYQNLTQFKQELEQIIKKV